MAPGASVAEVTRAHGVNASEPEIEATEQPPDTQVACSGAIHIELPGRATISVESGADPVLVRFILESLRK